MANNPSILYDGRIDVSDPTNYPYGKAQDSVADGDGIGTPYDLNDRNDVFGLFQALLTHANITPSQTPDTVLDSQYHEALQKTYGSQTFTNADDIPFTISVPSWVKRMKLTAVGGGGGGGGTSNADGVGGGGGGAGAAISIYITNPLSNYTLIIGSGGNSGNVDTSQNPGAGGSTVIFPGSGTAATPLMSVGGGNAAQNGGDPVGIGGSTGLITLIDQSTFEVAATYLAAPGGTGFRGGSSGLQDTPVVAGLGGKVPIGINELLNTGDGGDGGGSKASGLTAPAAGMGGWVKIEYGIGI